MSGLGRTRTLGRKFGSIANRARFAESNSAALSEESNSSRILADEVSALDCNIDTIAASCMFIHLRAAIIRATRVRNSPQQTLHLCLHRGMHSPELTGVLASLVRARAVWAMK
jgi:hypothetical protein